MKLFGCRSFFSSFLLHDSGPHKPAGAGRPLLGCGHGLAEALVRSDRGAAYGAHGSHRTLSTTCFSSSGAGGPASRRRPDALA